MNSNISEFSENSKFENLYKLNIISCAFGNLAFTVLRCFNGYYCNKAPFLSTVKINLSSKQL